MLFGTFFFATFTGVPWKCRPVFYHNETVTSGPTTLSLRPVHSPELDYFPSRFSSWGVRVWRKRIEIQGKYPQQNNSQLQSNSAPPMGFYNLVQYNDLDIVGSFLCWLSVKAECNLQTICVVTLFFFYKAF